MDNETILVTSDLSMVIWQVFNVLIVLFLIYFGVKFYKRLMRFFSKGIEFFDRK